MFSLSVFSFPANVRWFFLFRILFNARFYYPVFAIFFFDMGLNYAQFLLLNVAWAVTIILFEVPSGAMADVLGRTLLMRIAGVLMVLEMALWAMVPVGDPHLVFWIFLLNRIFSGLAEAAASGADEALAYDSMKAEGRGDEWSKVLEVVMRFQSLAFLVALLSGSLFYSHDFLNECGNFFGYGWGFTAEETVRYPVYLTLVTSFLVLFAAMQMREVDLQEKESSGEEVVRKRLPFFEAIGQAWELMVKAGSWVVVTRSVFFLILVGLIHDSLVRLMLTQGSEYYRVIDIPIAWYGAIGGGMALFGMLIPMIAKWMTDYLPQGINFTAVAVLTLAGLWGIPYVIPVWGVGFIFLMICGFNLLNFFTSHYLNQEVDSSQRATVLSFKSLVFNVAYGVIGLLFAGYSQWLKAQESGDWTQLWVMGEEPLEDGVFIQCLGALPAIQLGLIGGLVLLYFLISSKNTRKS